MPEKNQRSNRWRIISKTLGVIVVILLFMAVIGFGLLVGACGTLK